MLDLTYEEKVHLDKWDIDVVPFLTIETIADIVNDLITCDNGLERDMKLIADVLVACTDLYSSGEDVHYTYEQILYSGLWSDILRACPILQSNIDTIYREVGDFLGLNRSLIHFVDSLTHVVESVDTSKLDFSKLDVEQINDVVKKISDRLGK